MLNLIKRGKEIQKFRDHNIRMIINVNTKETLNTYATAIIIVIRTTIQKRLTKDENASCVTQWTIGGQISLHGLKVGVRILCYY